MPSPRPSSGRPTTRRALIAAAAAAALIPLGGIAAGTDAPGTSGPAAGPPGHGKGVEDRWIQQQLDSMTLEEKVGQLFVTYVYGSNATEVTAGQAASNRATYGVDTPAEIVEKYHLGGVIYFGWSGNFPDLTSTAELSNGLQQVAIGDDGTNPGLLISTDQESGIVVRLPDPATAFPGSQALAAGRSTQDARTAAQITSRELRAVGINQNFSPVADVNVNPANPVIGVRSFGSDASLVSDFVAAQVRGFETKKGVAAAAKHFPGHGNTDQDSHLTLPTIDHTRQEWEAIDKPPFQAAIDEGIDVIMTAHIVVESLDPSGEPATLSEPIMTGILREEMGYDGVIVTDALQMEALHVKHEADRIPVLALLAGVDQLLMPGIGDMDLSVQAVLDAVAEGELTEARIDESVERILRLKWDRGIIHEPFVDVEAVDEVVGTDKNAAIAQDITDGTVTALRNEAADGTPILPTAVDGASFLVTGGNTASINRLATALRARGATVATLPTGTRPSDATIVAAVDAAASADHVVAITYRAVNDVTDPDRRQAALVNTLAATDVPVTAVAVNDSYDVSALADNVAYLATYSTTAPSLEATAKIISGELAPGGKLPVDIPATDGSILFPFGAGLSW